MKKLLFSIGILLLLLNLSACKSAEDEIMEPTVKADQELADLKAKVSELEKQVGGTGESKKDGTGGPDLSQNKVEKVEVEEDIKTYDGPSFIKLNSSPANNSTIKKKPVTFTGKVSPNTSKIIVTVSSEGIGGKFVQDVHQLVNFKKGDEVFSYKADTDWGNLVKGNNFYEFEAFFDDGTSKKTTLTIVYYAGESFIDLLSPADGSTFEDGAALEFKGKVSPNVEKIVVTATGNAGNGFKEIYKLQNFEAGDTEFVYRAKEEWGNVGAGANDYKFEAYFTDGGNETVNVRIFYHGEVEGI